MGDNGHIEPVKTTEQLAKERLERYQKDPQSFIEIGEIVACAIKTPGLGLGVATFIGNCKRSELDIAYSELNMSMTERLMELRMAAQTKIIPAKGSMFDFARRKRA